MATEARAFQYREPSSTECGASMRSTLFPVVYYALKCEVDARDGVEQITGQGQ